jgi:putative cardiolipin synthase
MLMTVAGTGLQPHMKRRLTCLNPRFLALLLCALLTSACTTFQLEDDIDMQPGYALSPADSGSLNELADKLTAGVESGNSVFLPLVDNLAALQWRIMLMDQATRSIDMQYYLWAPDEGGRLLVWHMLNAADRGVRFRILIDDVFISGSEENLSILDSHPNIEIRVFNPWKNRGSTLRFAFEFIGNKKLNHRMHNKLFVADGHVAIVGGRNIGNPYFGLGDKYNFRDIEIIGVGPVAEGISHSFDLYWNDAWTRPGRIFSPTGKVLPALELAREFLSGKLDESDISVVQHLRQPQDWHAQLREIVESSSEGKVWIVYDDPPSKTTLGEGVRKVDDLRDLTESITEELIIASPYLIPTPVFMDDLRGLTEQGIRVKVLTNSLASTNHTMVNSGYAPWRRRLLEAGIELYEYRSNPADRDETDAPGIESRMVTLHSKTFVIDREMVYIGSLNMDPRSFRINSEMGLVIHDRKLAGQVADLLENDMAPGNAWQVRLGDENQLSWESAAGKTSLQPARHFGQRIADFFYGLLPIKEQL